MTLGDDRGKSCQGMNTDRWYRVSAFDEVNTGDFAGIISDEEEREALRGEHHFGLVLCESIRQWQRFIPCLLLGSHNHSMGNRGWTVRQLLCRNEFLASIPGHMDLQREYAAQKHSDCECNLAAVFRS